MRAKDTKLLWGRSGNRCAVCKIELTLDGSLETLGQMAHIVAHSPDGPRGANRLEDVDQYSNLILLCPNHHAEIDKLPDRWSVDAIQRLKSDHETWVSERLQEGQITIQSVDNTSFLEDRSKAIEDFLAGRVGVSVSLTPLQTTPDIINPLEGELIKSLNSARMPNSDKDDGDAINSRLTRPDANGVMNEDVRVNDCGHRIAIFRNGHCEYVRLLEAGVKWMAATSVDRKDELSGCRPLRYTSVAEAVRQAMLWLWNVWSQHLPFAYMTLTVRLVNVDNTILYSREDHGGQGLYGYPMHQLSLEFSDVVSRISDIDAVLHSALQRMVNGYGMILPSLFDPAENFFRPIRLR